MKKKLSTGIVALDRVIDSLYMGDNVVWESDPGAQSEAFVEQFIRQSTEDKSHIIFVTFSHSPYTVLQWLGPLMGDNVTLLDCFTQGMGHRDAAFTEASERGHAARVLRVDHPEDPQEVITHINDLQRQHGSGTRYVMSSITGMRSLWGSDKRMVDFFSYMCPRLYDEHTIAYWLMDKDAHSIRFKANIRHVTQVVIELTARLGRMTLKPVKLAGRKRIHPREIPFEIAEGEVLLKEDASTAVGQRIRARRLALEIKQNEFARLMGMTSGYISQIENNLIIPSLPAFMQICDLLKLTPNDLLLEDSQAVRTPPASSWLLRAEDDEAGGGVTERILMSTSSYRIESMVFAPGGKAVRRIRGARGTQRVVCLIEGECSVSKTGETQELRVGDAFVVGAGDTVEITLTHKTPVRFMVLSLSTGF